MVSFKTPPINEVVIGRTFLRRPEFLVPHFGLFWQSIIEQYPSVKHAAPILSPGESADDDTLGILLPRIWFLSADDARIVQLQQDRLLVNWRQTEAKQEYPRFPTVLAEFQRVSELFSSFLETLRSNNIELQTTRLDVTYVNIINEGQGWNSINELKNVFNNFCWNSEVPSAGNPRSFGAHFEFPLDGVDSRLLVKLNTGLRSDNTRVLRFELAASGTPKEGQSELEWLENAHHVIVHSFKDFTSDKMHHDHWGIL